MRLLSLLRKAQLGSSVHLMRVFLVLLQLLQSDVTSLHDDTNSLLKVQMSTSCNPDTVVAPN